MDKAEIGRKIAGLATSTRSIKENGQILAIALIERAQMHGDCSLAARLCRALPARYATHMANYLAAFSPINAGLGKTPGEDKPRYHEPKAKAYNAFNLDGAKAINWQDWGKAKAAPKEFNLATFRSDLNKLIKKYNEAIQAEKCGDTIEVMADIKALHEAAQKRGKEVSVMNHADSAPLVNGPQRIAA